MKRAVMWGSLGLIAWSYAGYPLVVAVAGARRRYASRADDSYVPDVALVIAAHNEAPEIGETLERLLELDYPGRMEIVVASDGSTDGTAAEVSRFATRGVRLLELPREGKVASQNAAVGRRPSRRCWLSADANARLQPDGASAPRPAPCRPGGRVRLRPARPRGRRKEARTSKALYWRFELWLREAESACGSVTGGNGADLRVRRSAYLDARARAKPRPRSPVSPPPAGLRSVYEPVRVARERSLAEDEGRVAAQGAHALARLVRDPDGWHARSNGQPLGTSPRCVSHRLLRYASGPLHLVVVRRILALAAPRRSGSRPARPAARRRRARARRPARSTGCRSPGRPGTTRS